MENQNQKRERRELRVESRESRAGSLGCRWALVAFVWLAAMLAPTAQAQTTGLYREIYLGIPGSTLLSFTNVFPPAPDLVEVSTNLFETPSNYGDNFGERYRGFLIPPVTGEYVFWCQGQNSAILFISPDESAVNKVGIAYNLNSALARSWYIFPTQQSTNIYLEAGHRYYVEALHKTGNGDDSFAIGWKLPNGTYEQPMPASFFRPFGQAAVSAPVLTAQPTNLTVLEQFPATFRVAVSNLDAVTYRWTRDGTNIPGTLGASLTLPVVTLADHGSTFTCIVSNNFGATTSATATLSVNADTAAPALRHAANLNTNAILVVFTEALDPATALAGTNYTLSHGAQITGVQFGPRPHTIVLATTMLARNTNYILTVNNLRDRAAAPNTLAPNSTTTFVAYLKGIYRQVFPDLPGSQLTDLTNSPIYPGLPLRAEVLTNELATPAWPTNNYGQRLRALLVPPVTGSYVFQISAHDTATLYLSTNAFTTSARAIASVTTASDASAGQYLVQTNQTSAPIPLVAGQQYYLQVLMKSGLSAQSPPDHFSVRWTLPDGTVEDPIPVARLAPSGLPLPVISQHPQPVETEENQPASYSVLVSNFDPIFYQWQQNGTNLPGATNSVLYKPAVTLAENGSTLRCVLVNYGGTATTLDATLTVFPDATAPALAGVINNGTNRLTVTYTEPVEPLTATNVANYTVPGVTLSVPVLSTNGLTVTFNTTLLVLGSNYTVTVNNVRDRATTPNAIAPASQFTFTAVTFFLQNIGSPADAGYTPVSGGADITAGNGDFFGSSDAFNYAYLTRVGDFDVKVRVARLDFADTWSVASLMARENLNTTNKYAAVCATPSIAGSFFQYRTNAGVVPSGSGSFPVNYPYTWLRLQRSGGTTFHGYASLDGETWTKLGTAIITMPATIYLGFTVSSRSGTDTTTAEFRDFGNNTSTNLSAAPTLVEPLGPSSRRTGLAFSEILYNAAPRTDGRKIEFIELHNSNPFFENIGGYRLTGDISYTFPTNTIIPGGGFLVIARAPGDVAAVYGLNGVAGPYLGSLPGSKGTVRLRNPVNAILLELNYDDDNGWPIASDGPGHSLVLARPSYGENNPQAWAASDRIGGSPGRVDGLFLEPTRHIVINEYLAHTDLPDLDFIELFNRSKTAVDLSGCWLSDDPKTNKFRIPDGTLIGPTNFLVFNETQLGFSLNAGGEAIYLVNSNRTRVLDCLKFDGQENGVSTGRTPDGAPTFSRLASRTPGTNNTAQRLEALVINEIMYSPITGDDWDEFVEIYNRGTNAVNLGGWRLNKGVDYTFPTNTIIPINGYIVVGKDPAVLRTSYTNLNLTNCYGPFAGTLSGSGERLTLDMPDTVISTNLLGVVSTNLIHIIIDDVTYGTGGKWGNWSDGGGSSLELIDPRSDNRLPSNWADSDDSAKSAFTTMTVTGTLDHMGGSGSMWNALQLWLYEAGECLVDNVTVSTTPATVPAVSVPNGNFSSANTGVNEWVAQGTLRYSYIENIGGVNGNVLHVVSQDRGDTGANRINKVLANSYVTNSTATISASVKWLRGRPEMLFRLRGNGLEIPGVMNVPRNLGTPGARNSRFATNAGPAMTEVAHSPVLPAAGEPITVTARLNDPDGVASVQLTWRLDPTGLPMVTNMVDNGTGQDLFARDGIYTATIPGQPDNAMIAFYLSATDSNALVRTTQFPVGAPAKECLVHIGDKQPVASFASYRFWMTDQTLSDWITAEKVSSEIFKGTFIYGNSRIIYDAGSHYAGSPAHAKLYDSPLGTNCDYQLILKSDDAVLDETSLRIQEPGLFGADRTCQNESLGYWMINQMGIPSLNRRPINVFINGLRRGLIYEDTQRQNSGFLSQWFPDAESDLSDLYRIGYWYEYGDDLANRSNNEPTLQDLTTTGGVKKLARYRQTFGKRAVKETVHNYTNLFQLVDVLKTTNTGDAYAAGVFPAVDVTSFARAFAAERILNNTDLYGARRISGTESKPGSQNSFVAKPGGDKWKFLIWDIDAAFLGTPVDPLFDFTDPPISNLFLHPYVLRTYWQALEDGANGPLRPQVMYPVMDAKFAALTQAGIAASAPQAMKDFLGVRRDFILQSLSENKSPFSITANGGANFTNASTLVTLTGAAPFGARIITINGIVYPLLWSSVTNWSVRLPLSGSTNLFTVRGYDASSNLLANSTRTITVYFNGTVSKPEESLVINEIMYQPKITNAHYVEIYNRSTNTTFGLGGYRLNGADYNFPASSFISPLSYLTVVKDMAAFQSAYGTTAVATVIGEYSGGLDKDGEALSLVKVAASTNLPDTIISRVKYEARTPWSDMAGRTNSGVSLQLVDGSQDHARVSNWEGAADWRFFSYTATPAGNQLALWLDVIGEVFIDDIRMVGGAVAGVGSNYVKGGDFETNNLSLWTFGNAYLGNSTNSTLHAKSGTNSLRLAPTKAGTTASSTFMSQTISPTPGASNYTVSFWYRPTTNTQNLFVRLGGTTPTTNFNTRLLYATPGTNNSVARSVTPYPLLWLNEVQPNNVTTLLDNTGTNQPWLELYNSSTNTLDLTGYALSKSYTNLAAWNFPNGSVMLPGQFRVIFADGRPQFTTGAVLHTSFRLDALSGSLVLSRSNQILDYINYTNVNNDVSYGDVPDGQLFARQLMFTPTPGDTNSPSPAPVLINEWMASNTATITNPITGGFEDWIELYNFSDDAVDLGGYFMTDDEGNKNKWRIPNTPLAVLAPHSFLLVWADGTSGTNVSATALHANFKLSKSGDYIGLFNPQQQKVDAFNFGPQQNNVTQGRFPDGNTGGGFVSMTASTPRTNNVVGNNGFTPSLVQPTNLVANEGALITFTNLASDADLPAQALTFSSPNLPEGASLHPTTGLFTWQTLEQHGPGVYVVTIRVADNGTPSLNDQKNFQITVNESNRAPVLPAVGPQVAYTNTLLSFSMVASDLDLPVQSISYGLATSLAGAGLDGNGWFTFTAVPAQAPSSNWVVITATDSLGLSATQSFAIIVNAGLACGGYKGDVVPRGNPNGVNGITDWVQIGLFVAGLATAVDACETNRADCAPRGTCGDGILTTIDWVQAGRYAAGLDGRVLMQDCVPTLVQGPKSMVQGQKSGTLRSLSFTNAVVARGATNGVAVWTQAQGDENGFGFSVQFDTNVLALVSATPGADLTNAAMFLVNTSAVARGVVGVVFVLPSNTTLEAGPRALVQLNFAARAGSNTVSTPLNFQDAPVAGEISDSFATPLAASFVDGAVTVVGGADFHFSNLSRTTDGQVSLQMVGPAGAWLIQRSADLQSWETVRVLTNNTGRMEFTESVGTNVAQRFYRAVQP